MLYSEINVLCMKYYYKCVGLCIHMSVGSKLDILLYNKNMTQYNN